MAKEKKLGFEILKGSGKKQFSIGSRIVTLSPSMGIEDAKLIAEQHPEYIKLKNEPVIPQTDDTEGTQA